MSPGLVLHSTSTHPPLLKNRVIEEYRSRAKVRFSTKSTKDIANIVCGIDTVSESRVPAMHDSLDNLDTSEVNILDRRIKRSRLGIEEVFLGGLAGVRAVKVGDCAHDDDAAEIYEAVDGGAEEGLECGVVFLGRGAVFAGAVGEEVGVVVEFVAEVGAAEVDV